MKKVIAALVVFAFALTSRASNDAWFTDFKAAQKKAEAENKPMLLLFTGSDWCPTCVKWEKDAFNTPEFESYAKGKLVLVMLDFPEKKPLPKAQERANNKLRDKYKIEQYPEVAIVNPKGKKLGGFFYTEGGPKVLLGKIESTLEGKVDKKH